MDMEIFKKNIIHPFFIRLHDKNANIFWILSQFFFFFSFVTVYQKYRKHVYLKKMLIVCGLDEASFFHDFSRFTFCNLSNNHFCRYHSVNECRCQSTAHYDRIADKNYPRRRYHRSLSWHYAQLHESGSCRQYKLRGI